MRAGAVCAACGGVVPPMDVDGAHGWCTDCHRRVALVPEPAAPPPLATPAPAPSPPPTPRRPPPRSDAVVTIRRPMPAWQHGDGPFRAAGRAAGELVSLAAVDGRRLLIVTPDAISGMVTVARGAITALRLTTDHRGHALVIATADGDAPLVRGSRRVVDAVGELLAHELDRPLGSRPAGLPPPAAARWRRVPTATRGVHIVPRRRALRVAAAAGLIGGAALAAVAMPLLTLATAGAGVAATGALLAGASPAATFVGAELVAPEALIRIPLAELERFAVIEERHGLRVLACTGDGEHSVWLGGSRTAADELAARCEAELAGWRLDARARALGL